MEQLIRVSVISKKIFHIYGKGVNLIEYLNEQREGTVCKRWIIYVFLCEIKCTYVVVFLTIVHVFMGSACFITEKNIKIYI